MGGFADGSLAESAFHLLTVIDFLCLAAGTYLLLILYDRKRRSGYVLIAAGLAVLTLQIIPEHLVAAAPLLRHAGATLSLAIACILIAVGTLVLTEDGSDNQRAAVHRALLVFAATLMVLGTIFVWAMPFYEPLRTLIRSAASDSAFVAFQHGLRVAIASAFLACTWITWERRVLGEDISRMFGVAYLCWAGFLLLGVTSGIDADNAFWVAKSVKVLGSLFIGNALVVHVYQAERAAAERQRRLALMDRVTGAAIAAARLEPMIEAATGELRKLLDARVAVVYLLDGGGERLQCRSCVPVDCPGLPKEISRSDQHAIARALVEVRPREFRLPASGGADASAELAAVAVPLRGMPETVGVMVLGMDAGSALSDGDVLGLEKTGAQLGVMLQHMMLLEDTRQARDRWRQTFDSITELLTVHDDQLRIVAVNEAALRLTGMTEQDVIGRSLHGLFGSDCEDQEEMLRSCMETGNSPGIAMHRVRGRVYHVQVTPLRDGDHCVSGCVRVARDVTSRWNAEERLAQSERRYRELAESANDIIYAHDLEGNFLYVNPAAARVLGYSEDQLARMSFWDVVARESMARARAYIQNLLRGTHQPEQIETRMTCDDGRLAVVQLRATVLRREGQAEVVHGIARDVTAEKQLTTQLIQADRLASVGILIAGVAHELNNPLTAISGYADLLKERLVDDDSALAISTIAEEAERCRDVAQNLLNFARQTDDRLTEFDLNWLVRGVFGLRAYDLRAAKIEVVTDFDEELPSIVGEYGQIQQVIYNLVDNAYYAMQGEGGGVIEVATWASGDFVHLRVADSGPGVPEKMLGRIFEPFVTTKPRGEGTGLGLSICRRILEDHGGHITAHNGAAGGATFRVTLPVGGAEPDTVSATEVLQEMTQVEPRDPDTSARVLVIDDEPSLCALVKEYLTRQGHCVTVARTGESGLQKALNEHFDVILCDMRLPGMSGEDVCTVLLEEKPEAAERVLVATGDILSPQTQNFFERTGLPHIHKPFKLGELRAEIASRLTDLGGHPVHGA
ncbi:MAG: PAS domain S-box protein [Armatimonadota bacterium]